MFVSIDLETTGFDPLKDEILEIAAVKFNEENILEEFEILVKPTQSIPLEIVRLTGFRDSDFSNAPTLTEAILKLKEFIGASGELVGETSFPPALMGFVGHNIAFDLGFLAPRAQEMLSGKMVFDSLILSRILFPSEHSYALDQLVKRFSLPATESHRALPDARTAVFLFQRLLREAKQIPADTFEILEKIFAKTDWAYKKFFMYGVSNGEKLPRRGIESELKEKNGLTKENNEKQKEITQNILTAVETGNNLVIETLDFPDLKTLSSSQKPMVLAYGKYREEFENFPVLHSPDHYFSPEIFFRFIAEREKFDGTETAFLVKLAMFLGQTKTGLRHELHLHDEEWNLWPIFSGEGSFLKKAKARVSVRSERAVTVEAGLATPALTLIPHSALPFTNDFIEGKSLIVADALLLEDNLTAAYQKRYTLDHFEAWFKYLNHPSKEELLAKLQILFGILGMYYQAQGDTLENHDIILGDSFEYTKEGKQIKEAALNLLERWNEIYKDAQGENIEQLAGTFIKEFCQTLISYDPETPRWLAFFRDSMMLHAAPLNPSALFRKLTEKRKNIVLFDNALSLREDFSFFTSLFQLEGCSTKQVPGESSRSVSLIVPDNLPEPNSEGYFKRCSEIIEETLEEFGGGAIVLFHTKKALQAHFERIIEKPIAEKMNIFAVGKTGGMGKSIEQFLEKPDISALFIPLAGLSALERIKAVSLRAVVLQKIPFDFSYHPLSKLRQAKGKDGFNKYTLPKALLKLKQFTLSLGEGKKIIILDARLRKSGYEKFMSEFFACCARAQPEGSRLAAHFRLQ